MADERINTYEGMFLFPQSAAVNMQQAVDHLHDLLSRSGASLVSLQKWDERRLAYEIRGNKRGLYFLAYFSMPATGMRDLERNCNLSEHLLRFMFLRNEHLTEEQMQAADKRSELADEIRLRAEQPEEVGAAATSTVTTGSLDSDSEEDE